jgi:hypothetical protein
MGNSDPVSKELGDFINKYADDLFSMKLFLYFKVHPYAQMSELVIMSATGKDLDRRLIKKALADFVEQGIINKNISHDVSYYSLSERMRALAIEMDNVEKKKRCSALRSYDKCMEPCLNGVLPAAMLPFGY